MCDAIEGASGNSSGNYTTGYSSKGVGLSKALPNFADWFTTNYLPGCKLGFAFAFFFSFSLTTACTHLLTGNALDCEGYGYSDWTGEYNVQCFDS